MGETILVLDPIAPRHNQPQPLRRTLDGLAGKVVGFIDNAKPNFSYLVDDLAELLIRKYGVAETIKRGKRGPTLAAPDGVIADLVDKCDVVIAGSGD